VNEPPAGPDELKPEDGAPSGPAEGSTDGGSVDPWMPAVNPEDPVPRASRVDVWGERSHREETAGAAYGNLIVDQLVEARGLRKRLDARGIAVAVASGALATLLFVLTVAVGSANLRHLASERLPLAFTLTALVLAAIFGLIVIYMPGGHNPTSDALARLVNEDYWTARSEVGQLRAAEARVRVLDSLHVANARKMRVLITAIFLDLLAVGFLSWATIGILYGR